MPPGTPSAKDRSRGILALGGRTFAKEGIMELSKAELIERLKNFPDDSSVRFSFGGEELEVVSTTVTSDGDTAEAWVALIEKGTYLEPEYLGRHRIPEPEDTALTEP
jgi:hypothetical protein